ncbi:MAG: kinase/pyrophosphorylase [Rhodobiaceae bacterium]|nr:kinase/pyrophosphorylase [Rhodobiaceae bacterium]MCC0055442.1 kinase/pyrophosphorylase [Rhodobiaceae bacterium]
MPESPKNYVHLHLVSDATGETLIAVSRAAAAQYATVRTIEHVYPLVRSGRQLDRILREIEEAPGMVLYTLVNTELATRLEKHCRELALPVVSVLAPVLDIFRSYLGAESTPRIGGQHTLNQHYFRRIDALNYTMVHDDGQNLDTLDDADVVLIGISRTSKTPTSIYLANRGIKTANVPLVPGMILPPQLEALTRPLVVGLVASADRISQIRQNRLLSLRADDNGNYVDRKAIADEIAMTRRLCARNGWPLIDVTRRSIEESAAAVLALIADRKQVAES